MDYKSSGVDIKAGEQAVRNIKSIVRQTFNANVLTEIGSFGGLYALDMTKWTEPVMVSSTDGVGTKLIVARLANRYDTVGADLVNHCVNDIFVQGATPQFFNDYIGLAQMKPDIVQQIIAGMSRACIENEMALIGGEMAEMPSIYHDDDFDIVGTIVGLVERKHIITGNSIKEGDVVIGFASTGLHTNGYSLARKIVFEKLGLSVNSFVPELNSTVADALLTVHKSYFTILRQVAHPDCINGMAHITGGGLRGNIKRVLPEHLSAVIDCTKWDTPPLFQWLVTSGDVPIDDAYDTFNMGIGFVVITSETNAKEILKHTDGFIIGNITKREQQEPVILMPPSLRGSTIYPPTFTPPTNPPTFMGGAGGGLSP